MEYTHQEIAQIIRDRKLIIRKKELVQFYFRAALFFALSCFWFILYRFDFIWLPSFFLGWSLLLVFVATPRQLKFKSYTVTGSEEEIKEKLDKTLRSLNWRVIQEKDNYLIAVDHHKFFSLGFYSGIQVHFIIEQNELLINMQYFPDPEPTLIPTQFADRMHSFKNHFAQVNSKEKSQSETNNY